jgi:UDP-N-acetylmuramoyl-L-alanyl-D-glutamate--2,6-diaminopimelate ligase
MAIIAQVEKGVRPVRHRRYLPEEVKNGWRASGYLVAVERYDAIETAIAAAKENDVVLIAGKGHETYQILADKTIHFDDRETAESLLSTLAKEGVKP